MTATLASPAPASAAGKKTANQGARQSRSQKQQKAPQASPELMDQFTQQTEEAQNENLRLEHEAQLRSQQTLSQGRIAAMQAQLQIQLFNIWNEVWLQRQKVHDEAFKAWLKLLIS